VAAELGEPLEQPPLVVGEPPPVRHHQAADSRLALGFGPGERLERTCVRVTEARRDFRIGVSRLSADQ
jgi:hypothetical protein